MLQSLDDLLCSLPLTIDVVIEHELTGTFPVKGVEFDASVLYVELPDYFRLTLDLQPGALLIHGNMFIAWLERLIERAGVSAVYSIAGSSVLLVFSPVCGSSCTPFIDALHVARLMGEHDVFGFHPLTGIASGVVMAGSAFFKHCSRSSFSGRPLFLANACAKVRPAGNFACCITFPVSEWRERMFGEVFSSRVHQNADQKAAYEEPLLWEAGNPRTIEIPGMGGLNVLDIASFIHWNPRDGAEHKASEWFLELQRKGYYRKS